MSDMVDDDLLGGEDEIDDDTYDITNEREEALLQDEDEYTKGDGIYDAKKEHFPADEEDDILDLDIEEDFHVEDQLSFSEEETSRQENVQVSVEKPKNQNLKSIAIQKTSASKPAPTVPKNPKKAEPLKNNIKKEPIDNKWKRGNGNSNFQFKPRYSKNNIQRNNTQRRKTNGTVLINPRFEGTVHVNENNARLAWDNSHYPQNNANSIQPWVFNNNGNLNPQNHLLTNNLASEITNLVQSPNILLPQTTQPPVQNFYNPPSNRYEHQLSFEPPPNIVTETNKVPHSYGSQNSHFAHWNNSFSIQSQVSQQPPAISPPQSLFRETPHFHRNRSGERPYSDNNNYNGQNYSNQPRNLNFSHQNKNFHYMKWENNTQNKNYTGSNYSNNSNYSTIYDSNYNRNVSNYNTNNPTNFNNCVESNFGNKGLNNNLTNKMNTRQNNKFQSALKQTQININRNTSDKNSERRKAEVSDRKHELPEKKTKTEENRQNVKEERQECITDIKINEEEDEETRRYRLKIEEQKRERERLLKIKEERRKQMMLERQKQEQAKLTAENEKKTLQPKPLTKVGKTIQQKLQHPKAQQHKNNSDSVQLGQVQRGNNSVRFESKHHTVCSTSLNNSQFSYSSNSDPDLSKELPNLTFKIQNDQTNIAKEVPKIEAPSSFMSNRVVVVKNRNNPNGMLPKADFNNTASSNVVKSVTNENNESAEVGQVFSSFFNNRKVLKKDNGLPNTRLVVVNNLSTSINHNKLTAMCSGIGEIQTLQVDKQERQATILFKSVASAHAFFKKYQRRILDDLSVIEVKLEPML